MILILQKHNLQIASFRDQLQVTLSYLLPLDLLDRNMKSTTSATLLLLAALTTAAPHNATRQKTCDGRRLSPLRSGQHRTTPPLRVNSTGLNDKFSFGPTTQVHYSSNWAGAVQIGDGITEVFGQVTFPRVTAPANGDAETSHGGSVWIGIDGDTCPQSLFQTGIDWVVQGNTATYAAWYEWLPDASYDFDIDVNPGDEITMKVVAAGTTGGTASVLIPKLSEHLLTYEQNHIKSLHK